MVCKSFKIMNEQHKFKNLWIAIISLFVLNLGTLGWILFKNHGQEPPISPVKIEEVLGFDSKQILNFKPLLRKHFETVIPLRDSIKKDKDLLFDWIKSGSGDTTEFNNRLESLSVKVMANERNTMLHFKEIRNLCTPEQKKVFDEVLIEQLKKQGEGKNKKGMPPPPTTNESK
jgi:periplasmic protein CpxP/Spy